MKNAGEIKQLLEYKRYILSKSDYLAITENMDIVNYLSYRADGDCFVINLGNEGEYIFRLTKEQ